MLMNAWRECEGPKAGSLLVLMALWGCYSPNEPLDADTKAASETSATGVADTGESSTGLGDASTSGTSASSVADASTGQPGSTSAESGSSDTGVGASCGDGFVDDGENCDDGDGINGNGCNNDCLPSGQLIWELDASEGVTPYNEADGPFVGESISATSEGVAISIPLFPATDGSLLRWIDANGNIGWSSSIALDGTVQFLTDVAVLDDSSVLASGYRTQVGFDASGLVLRYDADGTILWSDVDDSADGGYFGSVAQVGPDRMLAMGIRESAGEQRTLWRAYDAAGMFLDESVVADPSPDVLLADTAFGSDGSLFIGHQGQGAAASIVTRYDDDGDTIFAAELGPTTLNGVAADGTDVVVVGETEGGAAWIAKYTGAGQELWVEVLDNGEGAAFMAVAVDTQGQIIAVGRTRYAGSDDRRWILKFTADGDELWEREFYDDNVADGADFESLNAVALDAEDHIYVVGRRALAVFADTTWVAKLTP